ncbi:hypothetical protein Q7C36_007463 [Tachysurus vachellii]|uniref:Uncharacterized protein n=1 Tax=Tachysurus vachellii TaxID=175792 RepID=A0AA88N6Q1_TACVA|nr:hypothetical protein Q7C36_007463 [Tachysurus vachellii]
MSSRISHFRLSKPLTPSVLHYLFFTTCFLFGCIPEIIREQTGTSGRMTSQDSHRQESRAHLD